MLKVIIIDDEQKAIKSLQWELENFCDAIVVEATFTNALTAIDFLKRNEVDCVFLDIEMPKLDGFQFLEKFQQRKFEVIFVTAYDKYAINAIKNNAVDYLLKPIDSDDLIKAIEGIKKRITLKDTKNNLDKQLNILSGKRIAIPVDGKLLFLEGDEIIYCASDGNYTNIFLTDNRTLYVTKKIKEIDEILPEELFCRVHNCYLVNVNKVKEYIKTDGILVLDNQKMIPVSRNKKSYFLDQI